MDLAALLVQSNLEAAAEDGAYDTDEFEEEQPSSNAIKSNGTVDTAAVLRAAADKVAVQEKKVADRVFNETAGEMGQEIKAQKKPAEDPDTILANASRTVNEHYNRRDPSEAMKYSAAEEKQAEEDEDEGESDAEDGNDDDPELNQSLFFAVFNERLEAVKTALRKGANYFARDRHGWTPLHWAASKGYEDILEALVDHVKSKGKNIAKFVNAQDSLTGWTALHVACVGGHLGAVESLLRYKARKNKLNFLKEKPSDCIGKSKHVRQIKEALGVPIKTAPAGVSAEDTLPHEGDGHDDHHYMNDHATHSRHVREESKEEAYPARGPAAAVSSGRTSGRPPTGPSGGGGYGASSGSGGASGAYAARYDRGNAFSDDGSRGGGGGAGYHSDRSFREEKES